MTSTTSTNDELPGDEPETGSPIATESRTTDPAQAQTYEQDEPVEDQDESDTESDDPNLARLSLKEGSERYVIAMNAIPQCYTTSLSDARAYMWEFARTMKSLAVIDNSCYLREGDDRNHIQLVGHYRFLVVSYDRPIASFTVHCVQELEEIDTLEEDCDSPQEEAGKLASLLRHFTG